MRQPLHCLCLATGLALGVLFVAGAGCGKTDGAPPAAADTLAPSEPIFDVRSVTLDARNRPDSSLLVRLRDLGVTHLTLVAFGWQKAPDVPTVRADTGDGWYSESHRGVRALARQADALGMGVILKPHLWVGGYDEAQDRSDIGFDTEADWAAWEADYRRFLMLYARLAAEVDADALVLGTELTRSATERPDFWRGLAEAARTVYDGNLTYAANWHEAYDSIQFWDALDYVGVQAYFPLTDATDPSLAALRTGWGPHRAALQARCYRAFLSTVGRAPWLKGGIIWKWHPPAEVEGPTAFTPQGKPAERVLRRWFTGAAPSQS
ncbi:hypothetical protein GGP77_003195 [Salinibacter ruber]|uniref:glycoside hydrolase family 113 n=1 Tax=Salinibacter ruber TaxID=146919 RepID=UPI00216A64C8|nr:hypothetical protein [Salinibacter ruber]MCS3668941.1 hypothetical protein [Salinibacter ruber]